MSNPRRFGKTVLYRVTEKLTINRAKMEAKRLREVGIRARVDTYQNAYAVWSIRREQAYVSDVKIVPKGKMTTLYHGATSSALAGIIKSGVVIGWWTQYIDKAQLYAIMPHTKESFEDAARGIKMDTSYGYPVILECRVPSKWFWESYGEQSQLSQPNKPVQTLSVKHLTACYHYKNYVMLNSIDDEFNLVRKHWIRNKVFKEIKSYVPKRSSKTVIIYHGTVSSRLPLIKRSKKVVGHWSTDPVFAAQYGEKEYSESTSDVGHPILIVAKVPERIIGDYEDEHIVSSFNIPRGKVRLSKSMSITGAMKTSEHTAQLPSKYVSCILHLKIEKGFTSYLGYFDRALYTKRKL